ncbi:MAG: hypothetical protein KC478_05440, partial [Bacteriovoracaceae bacterium]|nr:hypothetical protein [Bacteriovoracaceae bacterium]
ANKIEAFLQLGVMVKDQAEEAKRKEINELNSKIRTKNTVIDTKSVQRIERLGFLEPESTDRDVVDSDSKTVEHEVNYANVTIDRGQIKNRADIDMFSRKLVNDRDTGFSRKIEQYVSEAQPDKYTEEWLEKEPESVEELLEDEECFYAPNDDLFKYFILFSEMMAKPSFNRAVMFKLVKMVLGKQFGCTTKFYSVQDDEVFREDEQEELSDSDKDLNTYSLDTPNWSDETYSQDEYEFTMPYYTDNKLYGFGIAKFSSIVLKHESAAQVEAIFTLAKGVFRP